MNDRPGKPSNVDKCASTEALFTGLQQNSLTVIKASVAAGADLNVIGSEGLTPLMQAVQSNHSLMVTNLLDLGADPNVVSPMTLGRSINWFSGCSALHLVCWELPSSTAQLNEAINIAKILLAAGADVNAPEARQRTPLQFACMKFRGANSELLSLLTKARADVAYANCDGYTAFHYICEYDLKAAEQNIKIILNGRKFPKINAETTLGKTPLHLACEKNDYRIIDFLVSIGADPSVQDIEGDTPLAVACRENRSLDIIKCWCHMARIRIRRKMGCTLTHHAAKLDSSDLARVLLSCGAPLRVRDNHGDTAIRSAPKKGNDKFLDWAAREYLLLHRRNYTGKEVPGHQAAATFSRQPRTEQDIVS